MEQLNKSQNESFEIELRKGTTFEKISSQDPQLHQTIKVQMEKWKQYMLWKSKNPSIEDAFLTPVEYFGNVKDEPLFQELYKQNLADAEKYLAECADSFNHRVHIMIALQIAAGLLPLEKSLKALRA